MFCVAYLGFIFSLLFSCYFNFFGYGVHCFRLRLLGNKGIFSLRYFHLYKHSFRLCGVDGISWKWMKCESYYLHFVGNKKMVSFLSAILPESP